MMQILYQMDMTGDFREETLDRHLAEHKPGSQRDYFERVYQAFTENREAIDEKIARYSVSWKLDRMPRTDVAILRLATAEIVYIDTIPDAVSINEAVELAKKYGTEQSPKFVNAILGSIVKEIR